MRLHCTIYTNVSKNIQDINGICLTLWATIKANLEKTQLLT